MAIIKKGIFTSVLWDSSKIDKLIAAAIEAASFLLKAGGKSFGLIKRYSG